MMVVKSDPIFGRFPSPLQFYFRVRAWLAECGFTLFWNSSQFSVTIIHGNTIKKPSVFLRNVFVQICPQYSFCHIRRPEHTESIFPSQGNTYFYLLLKFHYISPVGNYPLTVQDWPSRGPLISSSALCMRRAKIGSPFFNTRAFHLLKIYLLAVKLKCTLANLREEEIVLYIGAPTLPLFHLAQAEIDCQAERGPIVLSLEPHVC